MLYRLVFFLILLASTNNDKAFSKSSCLDVLNKKTNASKVINNFLLRIEALNPDLSNRFYKLDPNDQNLKNLYNIVKNEAWRFLPNGYIPWPDKPSLTDETVQNIRNYPIVSYDTKNLSNDDIYMFYVNALQGLYISISNAIRLDFISGITTKTKKSLRVFLEVVYEDVISVDLSLTNIPPERTEEALREQLFAQVDWEALVFIFEAWSSSKAEDIESWLESNNENFSDYKREIPLFTRNIKKVLSSTRHCCKNTPGCLFCPNNRAFLAPKVSPSSH